MRLNNLPDFIDLANTLNFSASARNLNVSQSTLSRRIQALEKEAGVRLFDRAGGKTSLTAAGRNLYLKALQIEDSLAEFSSLTDGAALGEPAAVHLSGQTVLPSVNLFCQTMAALAAFEQLPVRLLYRATHSFSGEVAPLFSLDLLEAGEVDFAIETMGAGARYFEIYDSVPLYRERLCFVVSPDNPLLRRATVRPADLDGYATTYLEMFPKTRERYGTDETARGFDPLRVDKMIVSDALEVSAYLARLRPNEIVQFPASLASLFPFGAAGTNSALLAVDDSRAAASIYLFSRKDADPALASAVVGLARDAREAFAAQGYDFLAPDA